MVWHITDIFCIEVPLIPHYFNFIFYTRYFCVSCPFLCSTECILSRACLTCDVAVILPCMSALCVVMLLPHFHAAKTCETRVCIVRDGRSNSNIFISLPSQL